MKEPNSPSGAQVAFLTFAVLLLAAPLALWLERLHPLPSDAQTLLRRGVPFMLAAAILFGFPAARRRCRELLSRPIAREDRVEVALATLGQALLPFAVIGGMVLWAWATAGAAGVHAFHGRWSSDGAGTYTLAGLVFWLVLISFVGPVIEELVFRGLLYPAWAARFGWFAAMALSSLLFALYHSGFWAQFFGAVLFVCAFRRTGTLRAPILMHMAGNLALFHPLLGQYVVPSAAGGGLSDWGWHLACLTVALVAVPAYVWSARREKRP